MRMKILKTMDNILYFIKNADIKTIIALCERIKQQQNEIIPNGIKYNVNTQDAVVVFDYKDADLTEEQAEAIIDRELENVSHGTLIV